MFQIYAGDVLVYEPGDYNLALLTPKLTLEMGKAGSLEFTVPAGHPYTNELKQLTKPVSVDLDGQKIFRGRILSGSRTDQTSICTALQYYYTTAKVKVNTSGFFCEKLH